MKQSFPYEVVGRDEWLVERKALLVREKELLRFHDQICAERRALPWVRLGKEYSFEDAGGSVTLADLFAGRHQLFVYHFMLVPGWEEGCVGCSFVADHVDAARRHFEQAGLSFVAVSRAPRSEIERFRRRMGWTFRWVSSFGSDFNYDFHVSFTPEQIERGAANYNFEASHSVEEEMHGCSIFARDETGGIFHTYSTYARGVETLIGAFHFLDLAPLGRNEMSIMDWVRHHDRYENTPRPACCGNR